MPVGLTRVSEPLKCNCTHSAEPVYLSPFKGGGGQTFFVSRQFKIHTFLAIALKKKAS